jgi:N-acetylglucosamine kinase-like BadF-type ATPase
MKAILGIDQGSSQTRAAVCSLKGEILGVGYASGACHSIHGLPAAMDAVSQAARQAREGAGLRQEEITLLFAGMTGADWPEEYTLLERELLSLGLAPQVHAVSDCLVALRGGTLLPYGAILIAGTGANCAILSPSGEEFIYHYFVDDDLQGGVAIGQRALRAIYRSATGRGEATRLTGDVLDTLGLGSVEQLRRMHLAHQLPPERLKDLAPLVLAAAAAGDRTAVGILRSLAAGLAELVTAGLARFEMHNLEVEVVLSGSIFKEPSGIIAGVLAEQILGFSPRARLVNARYEPVVGALLLGLQAVGVAVDEEVREYIERGSQAFDLIRMPTPWTR